MKMKINRRRKEKILKHNNNDRLERKTSILKIKLVKTRGEGEREGERERERKRERKREREREREKEREKRNEKFMEREKIID